MTVIIMLKLSRQCSTGIMIDKKINGTEYSPEIDPQLHGPLILIMAPKESKKKRIVFSTNAAAIIRYLY